PSLAKRKAVRRTGLLPGSACPRLRLVEVWCQHNTSSGGQNMGFTGFDRQTQPGSSASTHVDAATPGKRTLTEALSHAPVQRAHAEDGATSDGTDVQAAAAHGTSGPDAPLPHLDLIQRSFGRHPVDHVRAHVGGPAAEGASAMGADAFATGD